MRTEREARREIKLMIARVVMPELKAPVTNNRTPSE